MEYSFENVGQRLTVPEAAQELRSGRMIMLLDHNHSHTDATLCLPAQFVNTQILDLIKQVTQEEIAVVLSGERLEALQIASIPASSTFTHEMALAACIDVQLAPNEAMPNPDSAAMIRTLVNPATRPSAILQPGHIAVLRPQPGGVLRHNGRVEAVNDLLRIAGLEPGAVIAEIALEDEAYTRQLGAYWGGGILALDDIAKFRKEHHISFITETRLPTAEAEFCLRHFQEIETGQPYLALILGDPQALRTAQPLLRLHSACATGDIFGSQRCDCQAQLHAALHQIVLEGQGILLYLPQEGRGIGLAGKLQAYALQDQGYDTLDANEHLGYPIDARDYSIALEILQELGIASVRLLTNNPTKINTLRNAGIAVESLPLEIPPNPHNVYYLQTKRQRMDHTLTFSHTAIRTNTFGD